jgi:hypothetical protein
LHESGKKVPTAERINSDDTEHKIRSRESIYKKQRIEEEKKKKKSKLSGAGAGGDNKHINVFYSNENLWDVQRFLVPQAFQEMAPGILVLIS